MKLHKFFINHGAVNPVEGMVMTQQQFWNHLHSLIKEKGWSIRLQEDGSIRLARSSKSEFSFCPLTAVCLDIKGGKPKRLDYAVEAGKELELGPHITVKVMRIVDGDVAYKKGRSALLKKLGL